MLMEDHDRVMILSEILSERLPYLRNVVDEWSVAESDALNYAQAKDLIWQLMAPLGISLVGFKAAERVLDENPTDQDAREAYQQFTSVGREIGDMIEYFLQSADSVRH
jgi:hypothetical protein